MRNSLFCFVLALSLASCSPKIVREVERVEVPVIHTEYKNNTVRDTVWSNDSVFIIQKGDTVYNTTKKEFHHYHYQSDTVHSNDTTTIIKEVPYPVEVEKELTKWEKFKADTGGIALGAVGVCLLYLIIRRFRR